MSKALKKLLSSAFFLLVILTFKSNICYSNTQDKIYILPSDTYVTDEGIFVNFEDVLLSVESLFSDKEGVYILADSLTPEARKWRTWTCPYCGYENSFLDSRCQNPSCPKNQE